MSNPAQVDPKTGLPINALLATFGVTFVLSGIICGSSIAFQNITSITIVGLLMSYGTTIATMLYRRWSGIALPPARWRYPQAVGYTINILALCFIAIAFLFAYFPTGPDPTAESMNWSIVVTLAVMLVATLHYVFKARKTFEGPVVRIKKAGDEDMIVMENVDFDGKK